MALPLTPQQKLEKKLRTDLRDLHNRVLSAWNFHEIKLWKDVYARLGYPSEKIKSFSNSNDAPTYPLLKEYLQKQVDTLEAQLKGTNVKQDEARPQPLDKPGLLQPRDRVVTNTVVTQPVIEIQSSEKKEPDSWYGLHKSKNEKAFLMWFQKKAIAECWQKIIKERRHGILILSATGTGKTWMAGGLLRRLEDINFAENRTWSHIPYLYVTRASIVTKTERDILREFCLGPEHYEVINIEQLRSRAGQMWVREELYIDGGEEKTRWIWKNKINPCVILFDECQALKNAGSTQHQIASAYSDLKNDETYQVFISATPFTKVIEAKCFAVSTRKDITMICGKRSPFPEGAILTNETWPTYASIVAYPSKPEEYNESAVERLMLDLEDYVVRVKGVRPQFDAINSVEMIDFECKADFDFYHAAWERYLKEKARLEALQLAGSNQNVGIMILVQFLKFRMAAELVRSKYLARQMHESVQNGKAAVCAVNFKNTIISIVQILVNEYHVPRNQISLIWGGGQTQLTAKQKAKAQIKSKKAEFEAMGMSTDDMLEQLDLDAVEDRELMEIDPALRLGMQSLDDRQIEIDKFQSGKSLYCLYTLRAGGVGLSLHHTDEYTKFKCRRKDSGYAVEEDIPNVPVRQREVYVAPTWSPIELVQGVGRVPRLTSLSPTKQKLVYYRGTIEGRVADIANKGLRCLSKIVRSRENWADIILDKDESLYKNYMSKLPDNNNGESSSLVSEGDDDSE